MVKGNIVSDSVVRASSVHKKEKQKMFVGVSARAGEDAACWVQGSGSACALVKLMPRSGAGSRLVLLIAMDLRLLPSHAAIDIDGTCSLDDWRSLEHQRQKCRLGSASLRITNGLLHLS
jgi:hypothetical protein